MTALNNNEISAQSILKTLAETLGGEVIAFGIRLLAGIDGKNGDASGGHTQPETEEPNA
jgi:hypothetical protein